MQLISKYNKVLRFLLCVINIHSKYTLVFSLKYKRGIAIINAFQKILDKSSKIFVDKGSKFYNRSMKLWLQDKDIELYSSQMKENLLLLKDLLEP